MQAGPFLLPLSLGDWVLLFAQKAKGRLCGKRAGDPAALG